MKKILVSALIGGAASAVTSLLFAPKKGKELRQDIANQYDNVKNKTNDTVNVIKEKTQNLKLNKSESVADVEKAIESAIETSNDSSNQAVEQINNDQAEENDSVKVSIISDSDSEEK